MRSRFPHPGYGEENRQARLRNVEAEEIRAAYSRGRTTLRQLARDYGISRQGVSDIVHGRSYRHR